MKEIEVILTYFKESGKYYSEGKYKTKYKPLYEIWDEVINMLNNGKRPGLIDGHSEFHVLINVPEHKHDHPHLLICAG